MPEDWAEEVARLRDEVDKTAQRFENAGAQVVPVTVADSTGAIKVTVDEAGVLQDIRVDAAWRKSLDAGALGAAVQEALLAAAAQRTEAWTTSFAEQSDQPEPRVRPMQSPEAGLAGQLSALTTAPGGPPTAALEELLGMLKAINRGIDEATSEIGTQLAAEFDGRSSSGHVRAKVTGSGAVRELRYDQRWIEKAHHFNIGRESTEAIRDAHQKVANRSVQGMIDAGPLGEVLALAKDPQALAERLRLRG